MRKTTARLVLLSSEAFVALLCALSSLAYLGGAPPPRAVDTLLPAWMRILWGLYLLVGGVATLIGLLSGNRRIEKVGLLLLVGPAMVYATATGFVGGVRAIFPAGITFAFGAAFGVRASNRLQRAAVRALERGP